MLKRIPWLRIIIGAICWLQTVSVKAQDSNPMFVKLGSYIIFHHGKYSGILLHAENERAFRRAQMFTQGFRLDYENAKPSYSASGSSVSFFTGIETLSLGYQIRWYPFYYIKKMPLNGVYVGGEACYYTKINKIYRYGPALGTQIGYQRILKSKFSVGAELRMTYQQNLNDGVIKRNPNDRYFYLYPLLKFGIRIGNR